MENVDKQNSYGQFLPKNKAYILAIEQLAYFQDNRDFNNSSPNHAAIVMGNIFRTAVVDVKMFIGNLDEEVYDNEYYIKYLGLYLKRNLPLTLIFEDFSNKKSKALELIRETKNEQIFLYRLKLSTQDFKQIEHFSIGDGRMYRLEKDTKGYISTCSFNNKKVVNQYDNEFKYLLSFSELIMDFIKY